LLRDSEQETRQKALLKQRESQEVVNRLNLAIAHFDRALVTVLRSELTDAELESLSRLFNFDIFEQTVGNGGARIRSKAKFMQALRTLEQRVRDGVYQDENISVPLP